MITQLKPNTYYKTRDGRKAFVGFRIPGMNRSCPWVGRIEGNTCVYTWTENGPYLTVSESPEDLVAEWSEPKLRPWRHEEVPLGAWMREKLVGLPSLIVAVTSNGLLRGHGDMLETDYALAHYEHSTDNGKTWLPCGVME